MGGNAFKENTVRRIHRTEIEPTLEFIVNSLSIPHLTMDYVKHNIMGSLGKQETSGDIDIALNNRETIWPGAPVLPIFSLREVALRAMDILGKDNVSTKTLRGGQIQTAFPIMGEVENGRVQVDFITGNPLWLKFTHFSPGLDNSPFKGVFISTLLGVLAKMRPEVKITELRDGVETTVARVGYHYDLELGLYKRWSVLKPGAKYLSEIDPDLFESKFSNIPRCIRTGYIDDPMEVLRIIFGRPVEMSQIDTFEKIVKLTKDTFTEEEFCEIKNRFCEALMRSAGKKDHTLTGLLDLDLWK